MWANLTPSVRQPGFWWSHVEGRERNEDLDPGYIGDVLPQYLG